MVGQHNRNDFFPFVFACSKIFQKFAYIIVMLKNIDLDGKIIVAPRISHLNGQKNSVTV